MPIVTEDNAKIAKKLADGFKFSLYWNKYKMIPNEKEEPPYNGTSNTRKLALVLKELEDYLFLFMIIALIIMMLIQIAELKPILIMNIYFQG